MELTDQNLMSIYETFFQEQQRLLNEIKSNKTDDDREQRKLHQQVTLLTNLIQNLLKLKNLRKRI
jgi:hypothetical protein